MVYGIPTLCRITQACPPSIADILRKCVYIGILLLVVRENPAVGFESLC